MTSKTYLLVNPDDGESFTTSDGELASSYENLGWKATEMVSVAHLKNLRKALEFLDECRKNPGPAVAAGCFNDAREWIESAARQVIRGENNG